MSIRTIERELTAGWSDDLAASDWRERALDEALYIESRAGNSEESILRSIRAALPGCATMMIHLDRVRLLRFIKDQAERLQPLISGSDLYWGEHTTHPTLHTG